MALQDVRVVSVPVSDQDRAKEFYVEKLGFELTRDDDSVPGIRWVQVSTTGRARYIGWTPFAGERAGFWFCRPVWGRWWWMVCSHAVMRA